MTKEEIMQNPLVVPYGYRYVSNSGAEVVQNPKTGATYKFLEFRDEESDGPNKFCARLLTESTVVSTPVDKETHWTVIVDIEEVPGMVGKAKGAASWISTSFAEKILSNGQQMADVFHVGKVIQTELFTRMDEAGTAWNVSTSGITSQGVKFDAKESDFLTKKAAQLAQVKAEAEKTSV